MKLPHLSLRMPLSILATLMLVACETKPDRTAMLEEARHSVPPMAASETFFDGSIVAHLTLGGAGTAGLQFGDDGKGKTKIKVSGMTDLSTLGGNMGENRFGGSMSATVGDPNNTPSGGMAAPAKGAGYEGNKGMGGITDPEELSGAAGAAARQAAKQAAQLHDSELPAALLRLRLENTTQATLVVEVHELNSELGNFAVRPDTLTLGPGDTVETDPMESMLGLETYSVPVKVTLRAGGKVETKILTLQLVKPAADAPPPPAAN